ncbi:somatostatin receptor type 5-like [Montipora capricornis]|uniref:somatostatin receptor type 5-like n=1 Tax=Montipora capricornis TaxID=246305 RepID=UPI0035F1B8F9
MKRFRRVSKMPMDTADIVLITAYSIVVLTGICGNSLIIHIVRTRRCMHSAMNFLLVNLAIADLLTLSLCLPGKLLSYIPHPPSNSLENFFCKFITTHHVAGIGMVVSGFTLTLISVERYKALVRAMDRSSRRLNKGNVIYAIAAIWIFAILYVVPLFLFTTYDEKQKRCMTFWPISLPHGNPYWILLAIIVLASFITMFVCYFSIIKGLYFTNTICGSNAARTQEDAVEKRRIVKSLLIVSVVFVLCLFPYTFATATNVPQHTALYSVSYLLVYCYSSINPVAYAVGSANYRTAFREVLAKMKLVSSTRRS